MRDLEDKVAIVTGTTSIGKAAAKRLAHGGVDVLACGVDAGANALFKREAAAENLAIEISEGDVASAANIESAVQAAAHSFGGLDVQHTPASKGAVLSFTRPTVIERQRGTAFVSIPSAPVR